MQAIILAGGLGTRLRSVVPHVPKPMALIHHRPFLEYVLDYWLQQGVNHFILAVSYKYENIQSHFGKHYKNATVTYSIEEQPLGTGGALIKASEQITQTTCLAINGDTFFAVDLAAMYRFHKEQYADCSMATFKIANNNRYMGVHLNAEGKIVATHVSPQKSHTINGGVYLLEKDLFKTNSPLMQCSFENDLMPNFLQNNKKFYGFLATGQFIDIGIPEDYFRAETLFGL